jgi:ferredoxin
MTETKKTSESGTPTENVRIFINKTMCNGCGLCGEVCPFGLPVPAGSGKYKIKKPELCTECSACQRNCPTSAIIMQEQEGCGCLWDARQRKKAEKGGEVYSNVCGCGPVSTTSSCCPPSNLKEFEIKVLDAFNSFIKPNINTCCEISDEDSAENKKSKK